MSIKGAILKLFPVAHFVTSICPISKILGVHPNHKKYDSQLLDYFEAIKCPEKTENVPHLAKGSEIPKFYCLLFECFP